MRLNSIRVWGSS